MISASLGSPRLASLPPNECIAKAEAKKVIARKLFATMGFGL